MIHLIVQTGKQISYHQEINTSSYKGVRLQGKFITKNIINLSRRNLSASEISLSSKGLKIVSSPNKINWTKLNRELKEYRRKLHLMWHFWNDKRTFKTYKLRPKYFFNSRNKAATIETYFSCLEEKFLDIRVPSKRYNNLTKEELRCFI